MKVDDLPGLDQAAIGRAFRNGKFELLTPTEIQVAGCVVQGEFTISRDGVLLERKKNIWTTEGFDYLLTNGVIAGPLYIAPYENNVAPQPTWTATAFPATAGEITTGYVEATRQQWNNTGAAASGTLANDIDAIFTSAVASMIVWGSGLLDTSAKGGTAGSLIAATQFVSSSTYGLGITCSLGYSLSLAQPS